MAVRRGITKATRRTKRTKNGIKKVVIEKVSVEWDDLKKKMTKLVDDRIKNTVQNIMCKFESLEELPDNVDDLRDDIQSELEEQLDSMIEDNVDDVISNYDLDDYDFDEMMDRIEGLERKVKELTHAKAKK